MGLESVTYISDFNVLWPLGGDSKSEGDNHIRNLKLGIKQTFPNISATISATHAEINALIDITSDTSDSIYAQLASKAGKGANTDITSLAGLTTPLSVAQGGTGLTAAGTSGNVVMSDGSTFTSAALPAVSRLLRITRYTTAGSGTWNVPADTNAAYIIAVGAGAGGTGGPYAPGGGAGGYCAKYITSLSASYAYTVGAGGAGGTSSGAGGSGGNTTIAGMTAGGGTAVLYNYGGNTGGSASGGDVNVPGNSGETHKGSYAGGGNGGSGPYGGAGGGGGYSYNQTGGVGYMGSGGGGGGAGAGVGGNGGDGYIEIWEYS